MTFAGDVVHLDADPVGVLEENRVVPRGELRTVLGRMDDSRLELLDEEMMDRVDVRTTPCAETEMVKARAVLVERAAARALRRSAHEDSGAAADAIDEVLASDERLHPEEVTEFLPEGDAACRVVHGELDVRDAVQLDGHGPVVPAREGESMVVGGVPSHPVRWSWSRPALPEGRIERALAERQDRRSAGGRGSLRGRATWGAAGVSQTFG